MPLITYNAHNLNGHWKKACIFLCIYLVRSHKNILLGLHSELPWFFLGYNVLITTSTKINV